MSKFVKIASVLFETKAEPGSRNAGKIVLKETTAVLEKLKGRNLDLVVFSEGIEFTAQKLEDAEDINNPES